MRSQFAQFLYWLELSKRGFYLRLFTNDHYPDQDHDISDYDLAVFDGAEGVRLDRWGTPALAPDGRGQVQHPIVTFRLRSGDPAAICGYFVTDRDQNHIYWAERDPDAPVALNEPGDEYRVLPRLRDRNDPLL